MKGVDISHYQKGLSIKQIKDADNEFTIIKLTEHGQPQFGTPMYFEHIPEPTE